MKQLADDVYLLRGSQPNAIHAGPARNRESMPAWRRWSRSWCARPWAALRDPTKLSAFASTLPG